MNILLSVEANPVPNAFSVLLISGHSEFETGLLPTDCISGYLIFEGKNYSDRVAIIGFRFWLSSNILNQHINGGIHEANLIIK